MNGRAPAVKLVVVDQSAQQACIRTGALSPGWRSLWCPPHRNDAIEQRIHDCRELLCLCFEMLCGVSGLGQFVLHGVSEIAQDRCVGACQPASLYVDYAKRAEVASSGA